MSRSEMLRLLEQTLRLQDQSLTGLEPLQTVPNWDSMATLNFIVMADRKFGARLKGNQVLACQTVNDLVDLLCTSAAKAA